MPNPWIQNKAKEKKKRMLPVCVTYNGIFISKLNQDKVYTIALFTLFVPKC